MAGATGLEPATSGVTGRRRCGMASLAGLSRHRRPCTDCDIALQIALLGTPLMLVACPVPPWPDTLGGDNWATAGRGLSPYRSRASPRRKLPAFTIPTRRLYCTSATNNPLKKLMIVNVPPYLATLLRVGYRGQGHEEHNRSRLRSSQACTPLGVSLYRNTSVGSRDMIILRSQA